MRTETASSGGTRASGVKGVPNHTGRRSEKDYADDDRRCLRDLYINGASPCEDFDEIPRDSIAIRDRLIPSGLVRCHRETRYVLTAKGMQKAIELWGPRG